MENCILVNKPICHTLLKTMQMQFSFIAINHKTQLALLTLIGQTITFTCEVQLPQYTSTV
jgi:hypothetical protein